MNADIVQTMRDEEADLVRKLQAVRDFLSAYGEPPKDASPITGPEQPKPAGGAREKVEITSFTEQTRRSVVLAIQRLTISQTLVKTRDLVDFVESMGHEISGENKVNALGALLARSVNVIGHGKSGWSLADREKAVAIVNQYAPKENEPPSETAGGSDAGSDGWSRPVSVLGPTPNWPTITRG